ncbi:N-acetylmuramoyl-L-alanine amidase [Oceanobacillus halophilus]|uniref:MurNAc-LAA domain-containing protein n=1 Tax=Oceanobacillus halophilus TaxID=930130 RepID=A0A495A4V3_9BACI|nr:N-acetylmuramoyl-L-alanine amidase [Oceanobacillus halophilus]RKQ34736.1 hypothetical protein D8M06_07420 [Oceanobacillus halophilus]
MVFRVAVGAGHGGRGSTPGKRTPDGEYEWNFNDKVADAFIAELNKYENVNILRLDDDDASDGLVDVSLRDRIYKANRWGADIYVSFHHNALAGRWGTHGGTETYYYVGSREGMELAMVIHDAVVRAYGLRNRGIKRGNHLYVIRNSQMPAVLVEGGFMDSVTDIKKLRDDQVLARAGRYAAEAVAEYAGLTDRGRKTPSENETSTPKTESSPNEQVKSEQIRGDIAEIQDTLNKRYNQKLTVDNLYGPNTHKALVRAYQTELNKQFNARLNVDGIFGPRTKRATVAVMEGARGNLTWVIQAMLAVKGYDTNGVDGIYGNGTENAIKQFQRDSRIAVDGIFGPNTAEALFDV